MVVEAHLEVKMPGKSKASIMDDFGEKGPDLGQFAEEATSQSGMVHSL